ncbi:Acetylxylan esterase-like protein [Emericellopsis cladophorae]|uniref:Acetylxylan esterase-like protein n=1 Tax=Emericellopsis cladophorae TaxID=2686198 RepID=A0A9P9XWU4_9HYPO|nr:Acetylxylan esterase-like protein [Emericellopsis cladophorae]KAI6779323.1 Acetylxylan esterase-like protein [Emericellopsis cladophorae]
MLSSVVSAVALAGAATASVECARGLHIIVARGSNEDAGTGITGTLADRIADRIPGSNVAALDYPATITDPAYFESVDDGSDEMRDVLQEYIDECPGGKVAVMGYSQGAQVSADAFCGDVTTSGFGDEDGLPFQLVDDPIVAIVLFGDPSHVANATYNRGTADSDGLFPRRDQDECEKLGSRIVSYCDEGDEYCDLSGERDYDVHGEYVQRYGDEVVDFVVDRYQSVASGTDSSTSVTTPTPTPTPTSGGSGSDSEDEATGTGESGAEETGEGGDSAAAAMLPSLGLVALLGMAML